MALIIPINPRPAPERRCSFCARPESRCKKLVASAVNDHHICEQCVAKALRASRDADEITPETAA
jgi:hypothetical protein